MKIRYIVILPGILAFCFATGSRAQERLVSVASNPVLVRSYQSLSLKSGAPDTLQLPFIDDFSQSSPFPLSTQWSDSNVYVNQSFSNNPPTLGIATFDAIDSSGAVYSDATVVSFLADALTSKPVNLFLPLDTTVYLSFYYQPQGLGDAPEPGDSLIVEFYAPLFQRWLRVWSTPGTSNRDFTMVMINITDSWFLQKGFRFRFRNYASLAPAIEPSLKVNADHWNLDYVYLNNGRHYNDTIMKDASLVNPLGSLLQDYTAMPWEHFRIAGISAIKSSFEMQINNLSSETRVFTPVFKIIPEGETVAGYEETYLPDSLRAFQSVVLHNTYKYTFSSDKRDSANFEVSLDLNQTTPDGRPDNDKIVSQLKFSDYYAYDDGSSEAGYGLVGEGTLHAKLAYRFNNQYEGDLLYAVDFYFNRSFADAGKKYFRVVIWSDNNDKPGDTICTQQGAVPEYNGIDTFQRVILKGTKVVSGTYYIGWEQTSADFLNVGFDRQNNHKQDILFNVSGTWQSSAFEGALMIRPVFENKSFKSAIDPLASTRERGNPVSVYPNPANNLVRVDCGYQPGLVNITLADLRGRVVRSLKGAQSRSEIAIADLPNGVYLLQVQLGSGILSSQKLIIVHE